MYSFNRRQNFAQSRCTYSPFETLFLSERNSKDLLKSVLSEADRREYVDAKSDIRTIKFEQHNFVFSDLRNPLLFDLTTLGGMRAKLSSANRKFIHKFVNIRLAPFERARRLRKAAIKAPVTNLAKRVKKPYSAIRRAHVVRPRSSFPSLITNKVSTWSS